MLQFYNVDNPQLLGFLITVPTISDDKVFSYTAINTSNCAVKIRKNMVRGYTVA